MWWICVASCFATRTANGDPTGNDGNTSLNVGLFSGEVAILKAAVAKQMPPAFAPHARCAKMRIVAPRRPLLRAAVPVRHSLRRPARAIRACRLTPKVLHKKQAQFRKLCELE